MVDEPRWVAEAREKYQGGIGSDYAPTSLGRTGFMQKVFLERVLPQKGNLDILLVGIGVGGYPFYCSYEPYVISALLEGQKKNYRMVIVDKDPRVVADIRKRRRIFVPNSNCDHEYLRGLWESYLRNTGQEDTVVHEVMDDLDLASHIRNSKTFLGIYLKHGFRMAEIPTGFRNKLESGELIIDNQDIALAELSGMFDFTSIICVLYRLSEEGQKLALYNIASHTRPGGIILANEQNDARIIPQRRGWLTEEKQADLGVKIDEVFGEKDDDSPGYVLVKQ